jgi:hypothetical protein
VERIQRVRRKIAEEFGTEFTPKPPTDGNKNPEEKRAEINKRRRELYSLRKDGFGPEVKKRRRTASTSKPDERTENTTTAEELIEAIARATSEVLASRATDIPEEEEGDTESDTGRPTTPPTPGREVPYDF